MPFGVVGILLVILLILIGIFSLIAWVAGAIAAMAIFFVFVCVSMMLVILIQRPKGGGLAGAFGGVGGGQQTAFGAKVGDVLTWITVGFFVAFLFLAMGMTWAIRSGQQETTSPAQSISVEEPGEDPDNSTTPPTAPGPSDESIPSESPTDGGS